MLNDTNLRDAVTVLRRSLAEAGFADAGDVPADGADHTQTSAATVVWADRPLPPGLVSSLRSGQRPLVLAGPTLLADVEGAWTESSGLLVGERTPVHDVRLRPGPDAGTVADRLEDHSHGLGSHLGPHAHVQDRVLMVDKTADDVEVLLCAAVGLRLIPVASVRGDVLAWTSGTTAEAVRDPSTRRLLVLALDRLLGGGGGGLGRPATVRAGILGYGAIGHEHSRAFSAVGGLELAAVCDRSPGRVDAALQLAPDARPWTDPEAFLDCDEIDLVVVSTSPDTHSEWAPRAIRAGKHVVVEKPFAIRTEEADAVLTAAEQAGLLAVVYQNRRFDPDHLAVKRAVEQGLLGEVFHLETFVGGYGHPCNLWHSDETVSGGAFYDWGAHVLDQVLDLIPTPVEHVTAAAHKRRWFDVTNADHSRVTIRFADGAEAEFVHSDLAAALKPRWYVLGTEGAVVGNWRVERVLGRNDIGTLQEDVLAPADSPPVLDLHAGDGSVTRLATPDGAPHAFHRELADQLLLGLPMSVTGATSRRVLSVMQAATASAEAGGVPVVTR